MNNNVFANDENSNICNEKKSCSKVLLTVSAKDLRDVDPDESIIPYCVVSIFDTISANHVFKEIGRTEPISNTDDPEWSTKICLTYFFEEQQRLLFEVFDNFDLQKKRIGMTSMLLHEIVGSKYNRLTKHLKEEGKNVGVITVTAEELSQGRQESIYFVLSATNLDKKDFLGKCDPFLKILRINKDNSFQLAYRSRYHEQNLNPKWKAFEILTQQLCYNDKDREFIIECYDWDADGNHDFIGACRTTVNRLLSGKNKVFSLINEKKAKKNKKYVDSGQLHVHKVFEWHDYTFLDFISSGTELDFTVAIDFTRSNLPINEVSSLHKFCTDHANQYVIAIKAVAEICMHYCHSKIFNAYGFGAKIPPDQKNLETNDARCNGIKQLLNAYLIAQSRVELSGPTNFAPTIRFAAKRAASLPEDGRKYCILLIITDGVITDLEQTKQEIVKASSLPLSIIIIGVGYDTFDEMKILDSDDNMLSSNGKYARRDIVQFVQMRKFLPPHRCLTEDEKLIAKLKLAKEVLYEVPGQLVSYMKSKKIYPRLSDNPFKKTKLPNNNSTSQCKQESVSLPRTPRRILPTPPNKELERIYLIDY